VVSEIGKAHLAIAHARGRWAVSPAHRDPPPIPVYQGLRPRTTEPPWLPARSPVEHRWAAVSESSPRYGMTTVPPWGPPPITGRPGG